MFMYIHSWQNMLDKTETAKCIGYYGARAGDGYGGS